MNLVYNNSKITLINANTFFKRLMGFMFKKNIDHAIVFNKCNSIHTCFMKKNIDVIMCNKENMVLYYYNNFGRWKFILPKKGVYKVFETPANYFNIKINDIMKVEM